MGHGDRRLATRAEPSGAKEANIDGGRWEGKAVPFAYFAHFGRRAAGVCGSLAALSPALASGHSIVLVTARRPPSRDSHIGRIQAQHRRVILTD